jgi:peptidoglycan/xylan/chitin deacetylase (PgdA/CDA1 family)
MDTKGQFVISLDFELFWGVRDSRTIKDYGPALAKVHDIVPDTLLMFREYGIKATFGTVGLMFSQDKKEMISYSPELKPNYKDRNLSPYSDGFSLVKDNAGDDPYHYGLSLIETIARDYPEHEIGTHTFSHYYCQEPGQNLEEFRADLLSAIAIANAKGIELYSLIFPRNQYNPDYLEVARELGILTYRGNEKAWYYAPKSEERTSLMKKVFRTLDCYINISGHNCYKLIDLFPEIPYNINSSRFLRPYMPKGGAPLEYLKLKRIKDSMSYAAKNKLLYHIWWHPHNFGFNTDKNMDTLRSILEHYKKLNVQYGFESTTMLECSAMLDSGVVRKRHIS